MSLFHLLILKKLKLLSLIFVASNINQNPVQKASIMYLNKEATNKHKSLKYFLLIRKKSIVLKIFWKKMSFLEIKKGSYHQQGYFPQEYISVLQSGHYLNFKSRGLCNLYWLCNPWSADSCKQLPWRKMRLYFMCHYIKLKMDTLEVLTSDWHI